MNCRKCRRRIFEYRDGTLPPGEKVRFEEHLEKCPRCREDLENEKRFSGELQESYRTATASFSFDPDRAGLPGGVNSRSTDLPAVGKRLRVLTWVTAGAGAALLLAIFLLGPLKPGKEPALLAGLGEGEGSLLHSDEPPDPFRDWIERKMIITIEDKSAGTRETYLTDRGGTIRKITDRGREQ